MEKQSFLSQCQLKWRAWDMQGKTCLASLMLPRWSAEGLKWADDIRSRNRPGRWWMKYKQTCSWDCPCCCVPWIRFLNFTMNIACLRVNTDVCDAEGTAACLLESSIVNVEMSHKLGLIFIRLLTRHLCSCGCQWVQHGKKKKKKSAHFLVLYSTVISHCNEHKNNWTTELSVKGHPSVCVRELFYRTNFNL